MTAMRRQAVIARARADPRWAPPPLQEPAVRETDHLAFWVATVHDAVVGTVGLRRVSDVRTARADTAEYARVLDQLGEDVGEVRRLRIDPEWRRRGIAMALMNELISWSRARTLRELVLNTTSAQLPALALYKNKFGFREVGRSFLGEYELVWLRRRL